MSENKIDLKEAKKMAEEAGVELTDDVIDLISGGAIPVEIWNEMPPEERRAAQQLSIFNKFVLKQPCALDP